MHSRSIQLSCVRPSVGLYIRPSVRPVAAVGPAASRYRLLHSRRTAANTGSATLSAPEGWTQTCLKVSIYRNIFLSLYHSTTPNYASDLDGLSDQIAREFVGLVSAASPWLRYCGSGRWTHSHEVKQSQLRPVRGSTENKGVVSWIRTKSLDKRHTLSVKVQSYTYVVG